MSESEEPSLVDILAYERTHPGWSERKEDAIRAELGITPVRYAVLLNRALDDPDATESDPVLVHHLRARRERSYSGRARLLRHSS